MSIQALHFDLGYFRYLKGDYRTQAHRHYAIEIVRSLQGRFNIDVGGHVFAGLKSVLIPSNLPHSFDCSAVQCELLFIDPLSRAGALASTYFDLKRTKPTIPSTHSVEQFLNSLESSEVPRTGLASAAKLDARVQNCLAEIDDNLLESSLKVKDLQDKSFLSESRLAHLFTKETGISIRQYILWKRIQLAVFNVYSGLSLTRSAHAAGFTDSAHFHRVFLKMFGVKPFFALKN